MFSKHFSSDWILLVPNLTLLKYFDITLPRHKSSKIEGSGPSLENSRQKWGDTEIAEGGRSVLVIRARYSAVKIGFIIARKEIM